MSGEAGYVEATRARLLAAQTELAQARAENARFRGAIEEHKRDTDKAFHLPKGVNLKFYIERDRKLYAALDTPPDREGRA